MRRRHFLLCLKAGAAAWHWPRAGSAQTRQALRIALVGILSGASLATPANAYFREAFVEALRRHGWEEGKTLSIEARAAEGVPGRFAELAADLVSLQLDVMVDSNSQAIKALDEARHRASTAS